MPHTAKRSSFIYSLFEGTALIEKLISYFNWYLTSFVQYASNTQTILVKYRNKRNIVSQKKNKGNLSTPRVPKADVNFIEY